MFVTAAGFISDAITVGDRLTINAGVRFDHSRAISQDLPLLDEEGRETNDTVQGDGTLYTWNVWSPRAGVTMKLTGDGRTMLRASYGRFNQGVLTGELTPFHLADVWFLHVLPCVRAAGFKRCVRRRSSGEHHRGQSVPHVRTGPEQPDERDRASTE